MTSHACKRKVQQQGQETAHDSCRHRLCCYPDCIVQLLARDLGKSEKIECETGFNRCHQAVAQTGSQSSSEGPSGEKDSSGGLCESQETINIFSGVIWATACHELNTKPLFLVRQVGFREFIKQGEQRAKKGDLK